MMTETDPTIDYNTLTVDIDLELTCRICLENKYENTEELIHPCLCKGGSKYVHRNCLNTWRSTSLNPESFYKCNECQYVYKYSSNNSNRNSDLIIRCNTCQRFFGNWPFLSLFIHFFMFSLIGYAIDILDSGDVLFNILQYGDAEKYDVYLFLGEMLYVFAYMYLFLYVSL